MADKITKLLQELVEYVLLDEEAVRLNQLNSEKLALLVEGDNQDKVFILYNPVLLKQIVKQGIKAPSTVNTSFILSFVSMSYFELCEFWTIDKTAADKGYGPISYEIAMSGVSPGFVTSDRKTVKPGARKVWQYFFNNRANEFNIKQINPAQTDDACLNPNQGSDTFLQYAYSIKNKIDVNALISRHVQLLRELQMEGLDSQEINEFIHKKGFDFFYERFQT